VVHIFQVAPVVACSLTNNICNGPPAAYAGTTKGGNQMTPMEKTVMLNIADNEFDNTGTADDPAWAFVATESACGFTTSQLRGALSSCIKKGLVEYQEAGDESMVWLTEKGESEIIAVSVAAQ